MDDKKQKLDPMWPEGAVPRHLNKETVEETQWNDIVEPLGLWKCAKCGTPLNKSKSDERYCSSCYATETKNSAVAQRKNADWMETAGEIGLALYERQPGENDTEWRIWTTYRNFYPARLPTWSMLAKETGCALSTVVQAASRWSYRVRMISWSQFTDASAQEKRIEAIKEMNERQVGMAKTLQEKLEAAIENLDPLTMKPGEIVNIFKVATELERRINYTVEEKVDNSDAVDAATKAKANTRPEDMSEILRILKDTGVLQDTSKTVGIETTTRIVVQEGEQG